MAFPWGPIIGGAASLIGGWFGQKSSQDRNKQQINASAQQMAFQERMSNTAHQREMADLKAAGLNPILTGKYGGSSTPPGAMPQIENVAKGALEGASTAKSFADVQYIKATTNTEKSKQSVLKQEAKLKAAEAKVQEEMAEKKTSPVTGQIWQYADMFGGVLSGLLRTAIGGAGTAKGLSVLKNSRYMRR